MINGYRGKEICMGKTGIEAELYSVYNHGYHVYNLLVRPLNASFVHVQTLKEPLLHCLDRYLECIPFLEFFCLEALTVLSPFFKVNV